MKAGKVSRTFALSFTSKAQSIGQVKAQYATNAQYFFEWMPEQASQVFFRGKEAYKATDKNIWN